MDLSSALSITPIERIRVSCKGSGDLQNYCETKLIPFFDQNVASWKRQGRQFPFPLHVKFPLQFVPFSPDLLIDLSTSGHKDWERHAFLHLFFMKPSSVDEYRTSLRHEASEWFANVSQVNGAEWIIVFDSTKAREKKNRGALLERIKSDFAKYTARIVEIHEGSTQCMSSLESLMQSHLLTSLHTFVGNEESYLLALKEEYQNVDFNFIAYCEYQMGMSRLYDTLGVLENVLAKYDELDALLSLIVQHFARASVKPSWLCAEPYVGEGCPLLAAMAQCKVPSQRSTVSLIEIRSLILAHQIIISLGFFDERVRHGSEDAPPNAIQLKLEFAAIILRYSHHCIASICEEIAAMGLNVNHAEMQCWTVAFCIETMQFVSLLTQAAHVEHASYFACSISTRKCTAVTELGKCLERDDTAKTLVQWFEKGVALCGTIACESQAVTEISQILSDQQQFTHYMQKYHESSIALMKHFGWRRQSKLLGWHLANFLLSSDRVEGALPYLLKFVSSLIREGASILLLQKTLMLVVEQLEASPNVYFKELMDFYIFLSIRCTEEKDRLNYCKRLFDLFERNGSTKLRRSVRRTSVCSAIHVSMKGVPSHITSTPGGTLRIAITVTNELPLPIDSYRIRCIFKLVPLSSSRQKSNAGRNPLFECSFNRTDGVNRFGCIWKGEYALMPRDSISSETEVPIGAADEVQKSIVFEEEEKIESEVRELRKGDNIIELSAKASEVGVYMLENIEVEVADVLSVAFTWMDVAEIERDNSRRPFCFIYRKAATVGLKTIKDGYLLSGVAQRLIFELSSGSESAGDESTELQVTSSSKASNIEFWISSSFGLPRTERIFLRAYERERKTMCRDRVKTILNPSIEFLRQYDIEDEKTSEWMEICRPHIGRVDANEDLHVTVYVCKALRNLIAQDEVSEDASRTSEQICVKWLDKEWTFVVEFRPIMSVKTTTSLLEDKALFEMQISRTRNNGWIMLPQEALLLENRDDEPQMPAKLLNPKLTAILPRSTYRLVWALSSSKHRFSEERSDHEIHFTYRVKTSENFDPDMAEDVYDRDYVYAEDVAFTGHTACYELCAQILSSQPGAVLCRVDSACDLIVSLRSLTNKVETVVIGVDADSRFWAINEKRKLLYVKESGLGQTSFSIVPKMVGFLPYPSVNVFCCHHLRTPSDKSLNHLEQSAFGARLSSFIRTNGKQVHVLGAFNPSTDQKSITSEKSRRLKDAKSRLTKLFD